ncbi:hypothetical protein [Amycolatopsis sp. Hca4]|uniref:hypothetical protein n=1 Tax=Amycolatopsis sp. Hca4 TaxID=2742131 RepID=UPI0015900998|nr:hypothetical protein [Amycolatopsis sp. Hca4]QKV76330.1 hypothetical protein HUT10_22995 [Amycolatopsis sp. Hca4]
MPDDEEWAFEAETDLWDDGERPPPAADEPEPDGRDGDAVVTVTVAPDGEVRQVRLAEDWKSKVDPRGLHSNVLTAANAATIETLAQRAREVQENPPPRPPSEADETPLTAQDVLRLEDAVRGELEQYSARLSSAGTGIVSAESSGGHVRGFDRPEHRGGERTARRAPHLAPAVGPGGLRTAAARPRLHGTDEPAGRPREPPRQARRALRGRT